MLYVEDEMARGRFVDRSRPGDVFNRRLREDTEKITEIVEAMEKDVLSVCRLGKESEDLQAMVESLAELVEYKY